MFTLIALYLEYREKRAARAAALAFTVAQQAQPANDDHAKRDMAKAA